MALRVDGANKLRNKGSNRVFEKLGSTPIISLACQVHFHDTERVAQSVCHRSRPDAPACGQRESAEDETVDRGASDTRRSLVGMNQAENNRLDDKRDAERHSSVTKHECNSAHQHNPKCQLLAKGGYRPVERKELNQCSWRPRYAGEPFQIPPRSQGVLMAPPRA